MSSMLSLVSRARLLADDIPPVLPAAAKRGAIQPELLLVWLHVAGNLVWIGAAVAMGFVMAAKEGDPKVRGALARRIHLKLAMPAFVLSFLTALIRTGMDFKGYFVQHHWMHGKLPFALAVIALHHILGARARKMEGGSMQEAGPSGMLSLVLLGCAILAAFFVVLRFPD
jgi:protoporphyrinogen IX oxidase